MISIKTPKQIEIMKKAGHITGAALAAARDAIAPGVTTADIDRAVHEKILSMGATPTFLGYGGFPASACVSINDEVIHGIPDSKRQLHEGDIVKVDVGAAIDGFTGDCAATFTVGKVAPETQRLIDVTRQSFYEGIKFARVGYRVSDISHAIQEYAEGAGFSVVRQFVGHGVGAVLHEDPEVPNFGKPGHGPRLIPGMTLAIEPMINQGVFDVYVLGNNWTVVTKDHKLSSHYEHSVLITSSDPVLLTQYDPSI